MFYYPIQNISDYVPLHSQLPMAKLSHACITHMCTNLITCLTDAAILHYRTVYPGVAADWQGSGVAADWQGSGVAADWQGSGVAVDWQGSGVAADWPGSGVAADWQGSRTAADGSRVAADWQDALNSINNRVQAGHSPGE